MKNIFILTAALAFLFQACQAHTPTADLHRIEKKGYVLSGEAQAIIDQDPTAKDSMGFKDSSGHIFRIPQAGPPQQAEPYTYEDKSGNILLSPRNPR
jgi:hypothetical protein